LFTAMGWWGIIDFMKDTSSITAWLLPVSGRGRQEARLARAAPPLASASAPRAPRWPVVHLDGAPAAYSLPAFISATACYMTRWPNHDHPGRALLRDVHGERRPGGRARAARRAAQTTGARAVRIDPLMALRAE
jgi:hypothetical protein